MKRMRIAALLLILTLILPLGVSAEDYINRGQVADMLLMAADDYNAGVERGDIIKGYEDGLLHEERSVTRAEALVMLSRAFGKLPVPTGHNKRIALSYDYFTDIPAWAEGELKNVFDSGIVAGTSKGIFSPDALVTREQMQLFINRVYSICGTNLKDDFYATVNKGILERFEILPGNAMAGTLIDMQINTLATIDKTIISLSKKEHEKGTKQQKIADLYNCIIDVKSRNEAGIAPIKPYLEKIDSVKNITELTLVHDLISEELCLGTFVDFGLTVDFDDSSKYVLFMETLEPLMNKEVYEDEKQSEAYTDYLCKILVLSGEDEILAKENARAYYEFEKNLAHKMLDAEETQNLDKIYNVNSYSKVSMLFPDFDLEKLLSNSSLVKDDKIIVTDMALAEEFASSYNQSNLPVLKTAMKIALLESFGETLSLDFMYAQKSLNLVLFGTEGVVDVKQQATSIVQEVMPEYVSEIYGEMYFDEGAEEDILNMTKDIINAFKVRIDDLAWMDEETKNKAKIKLDSIKVKVGYPDFGGTYLDDVTILSPDEGGTYFGNMIEIVKAMAKSYGAMQFASVNHDSWAMEPYAVNAAYDTSANDITIPAAILMPTLYDKSFSYEEKLGGVGFIIAHEITHAFDAMGAKFDENGNVNNWWKDSDYKEFKQRCESVVSFFDGVESIPAVRNNGRLTLNENIADLGAAECITDIAVAKNLDLKKVYCAMAKAWAGTATREYTTLLADVDTHSDGKIRINRVLMSVDEFYSAFGIVETDGMYVPPQERVSLW